MAATEGIGATIAWYWQGNGSLWRVFWLWGVVGSWLLAALFLTFTRAWGLSWTLYLVMAAIMTLYTIWILVSVWRCAENARNEQWQVLARVLTVAWALNVVLVGAFLGLDLLGAAPA
ncbi:MAG: hypothetical protein U5K73_01840 [Halofilum sp. (in: g-proteobacteria)]|nr:hypothetical protein [Halofilum sp. (in: g-proteobacteria)]